jgi:hypothetical protein
MTQDKEDPLLVDTVAFLLFLKGIWYIRNTDDNKQRKLVVRKKKIPKQKQNKPGTFLEILKLRKMYAPVSRRFDGWSSCCKLLNEA